MDEPKTKSLAAPLFGVLTLPDGMCQGFVTVTLGYLLTHKGFSVAAVAAFAALYGGCKRTRVR